MPNLSPGSGTFRPDLTEMAREYLGSASQKYISSIIMPTRRSATPLGQYPKVTLEQSLHGIVDDKRAPLGTYNEIDWQFTNDTFNCEERGLETPVDDSLVNLYSDYIDMEMASTDNLIEQMLVNKERRVAALVQTGNYIATANISIEWSTLATATPKQDVFSAKRAMRLAGGLEPNTIVMGRVAFENLVNTTAFAEQTKYTGSVQLLGMDAQRSMVSQWFGLRNVLVGDSLKDTANQNQSAIIADIWDDEFVNLMYLSGTNTLSVPTFGLTFLWTEDSPSDIVIESYRDEAKRGNRVRARNYTGEKIVYIGANYRLGNITA